MDFSYKIMLILTHNLLINTDLLEPKWASVFGSGLLLKREKFHGASCEFKNPNWNWNSELYYNGISKPLNTTLKFVTR